MLLALKTVLRIGETKWIPLILFIFSKKINKGKKTHHPSK